MKVSDLSPLVEHGSLTETRPPTNTGICLTQDTSRRTRVCKEGELMLVVAKTISDLARTPPLLRIATASPPKQGRSNYGSICCRNDGSVTATAAAPNTDRRLSFPPERACVLIGRCSGRHHTLAGVQLSSLPPACCCSASRLPFGATGSRRRESTTAGSVTPIPHSGVRLASVAASGRQNGKSAAAILCCSKRMVLAQLRVW